MNIGDLYFLLPLSGDTAFNLSSKFLNKLYDRGKKFISQVPGFQGFPKGYNLDTILVNAERKYAQSVGLSDSKIGDTILLLRVKIKYFFVDEPFYKDYEKYYQKGLVSTIDCGHFNIYWYHFDPIFVESILPDKNYKWYCKDD